MLNKSRFTLFTGLLALLPIISCGASAQDVLANFALDELKRSAGIVGLASASYNRQGEKWSRYLGFADTNTKLNVSADTEFRFASVSKFITTGLLAKLVSEGKVDLDKSVYAYIPDFPKKQYDFTIRQLVTHTAGIPHYQASLDVNIDHSPVPYKDVKQGVSLFENRPLLHKPGSKYQYSSFAFNLLSLALENAGQRPFLSQLADMAKQSKAPSIKAERIEYDNVNESKLYNGQGKALERGNIGYKWAGGGLVGTTADLAKFGVSLLNHGMISQATLNEFNTPQTLADGGEIKVRRSDMGVGWRVRQGRFGQLHFHHTGSMPGARAHISVFPKSKESIVLLSNVQWSVASDDTAASLQMLINSQPENRCQAKKQYFVGKTSRAKVIFSKREGICVGEIHFGQKLTKTLAGKSKKTTFSLLQTADAKVALVTPIGIFQGTINDGILSLDILAQLYEFTLIIG